MRFNLRITALKPSVNKKLLARRLAADLSVEIHRAEAMLVRFPIDIVRGVSDDIAKRVTADYERMGCVTSIEKDESLPPAPVTVPVSQPSVSAPLSPSVNHTTSAIPPKNKVSDSKIQALFRKDGVRLASTLLIIIVTLFFVSKCPAIREKKIEAKIKSDEEISSLEKELKNVSDAVKADELRDTISTAFFAKAATANEPFDKVKFYRMAISFNEYNQAAWEGLIEALVENRETEEAALADYKKRVLFHDIDIKLNWIYNSRGPVIDSAIVMKNTLSFSYSTTHTDSIEIFKELESLNNEIKAVRRFKKVAISAISRGNIISRSWIM